MRGVSAVAVLVLVSAVLTVSPVSLRVGALPVYTVHEIPPLPGDQYTMPWGVNSTGAVVGWSWTGSQARPFLYTDGAGTVALPGLPNRSNGTARDINNHGVIVGSVWDGYLDQPGHAVRWANGGVQDLGTLGGATSEAWGVNDTGAVVGASYTTPGTSSFLHAFLYTDAAGLVDLTPNENPAFYAYGRGINDLGQVTGYRTNVAYRWENGTFADLRLAGFPYSFGTAINAAGQVACFTSSATGNSARLCRYTDGVGVEDLGGAGQQNTAWGINAFGDVVGEGTIAGGITKALLYTDAAGLVDLNPLVDPALQLLLKSAHDINDAGQILVSAFSNIDGKWHGLRLDPTGPRPPAPPVMLPARLAGEDLMDVEVRWTLSADDGAGARTVARYDVFRGDAYDPTGATYSPLASVPAGTGSYLHVGGGVGDSADHFYAVRAVNAANGSTAARAQAGKFSRPLTAGPNLVSVPLEQADWRLEAVFQTAPWSRVRTYANPAGPGGGWQTNDRQRSWSAVTVLDRRVAAWVQLDADGQWTIAGLVPASTDIPLAPGWNLVAYPSVVPRPAAQVLLAVSYDAVEGFAPTPPYYLSGIAPPDTMAGGNGYWIRVSQPAILRVEN